MLTEEQIREVDAEMIPVGVPVRFLIGGKAIGICDGVVCKSRNVMHQPTYWRFTRETAKKVAGWLGARAVFDREETP